MKTKSIQKLYPREWSSWENMHQRCNNPKHIQYSDYGGRGISICAAWDRLKGGNFFNFLSDMGKRPIGKTLDRIDVHGLYSPDNCQWADPSEQNYNKKLRKDNTQGRTGVSFNKKLLKYKSYIYVNGNNIHLGYFECFTDAVEARENAELLYYGFTKE